MGFFDGVKCFTGFHDWSGWSYSEPKKCVQTRCCKRNCGKREDQTVHEWPEFKYVSPDSCEQSRRCARCESEEKTTAAHLWTEWVYQEDGECDQKRRCMRCERPGERVEHQWGVWEYESPKSCTQVRFCRRCSSGREEKEPGREGHTWTEPQRVDCNHTLQVCNRCGEKYENYQPGLHVYGPWERKPDGGSRRKCRECDNWEHKSG